MTSNFESINPHPSVDTWIDYHAGKVSDEEVTGLRRHLSGCRQCVDLVLDLDAFAAPPPPRDGAAADFEKAAVWRTVKRGVASPQPAPRAWFRLRASGATWWPAVAAVAASMFFAVTGLSQRSARVELESRVAELTRLQPNMVIVDLRPGARERSTGGIDATVDLSVDAGTILIVTPQDAVDFPDYEIRVVDTAGSEVRRVSGLQISEFGNFNLAVPPGALAAGSYELRLFGLAEGGEEPLETYPIRLR